MITCHVVLMLEQSTGESCNLQTVQAPSLYEGNSVTQHTMKIASAVAQQLQEQIKNPLLTRSNNQPAAMVTKLPFNAAIAWWQVNNRQQPWQSTGASSSGGDILMAHDGKWRQAMVNDGEWQQAMANNASSSDSRQQTTKKMQSTSGSGNFTEKTSRNSRCHGKLCGKVSGKDGNSKSSSSIKKATPTSMAKFKREQQSTGMIAMTDEE